MAALGFIPAVHGLNQSLLGVWVFSPGSEYHELPAVEPACVILSLSLEEQNSFVVAMTGSFVGGSRLRAEIGNEVKRTMAEEEE